MLGYQFSEEWVYLHGISFNQSTSSQGPQPNQEGEAGKGRESRGYLVSVNGLCGK